MELQTIVMAAVILGGVGLTFGTLIAFANRKFHVVEDPRIDAVSDMLPGSNCGACGEAGCRAFAEKLVQGEVQPAGCTVMGEPDREDVAAYLGVDAGAANKRVARLLCAGGSDVAPPKAAYYGIQSCAAAVAVAGGGKGCAWGCVGLADCAVSCTFDAIRMNEVGLPVVDIDKCTACNDCVEACPLDLFTLMPLDHHLIVQCRSLLEADAATAVCSVACNACGRCVADAATGLIEIRQGLAVIDYSRIDLADLWLEGGQFASSHIPVRS
jgi:Na+-translocating ferredoxin:NAD+ oxidoreductase subunit B